jgi:hypothetical protein
MMEQLVKINFLFGLWITSFYVPELFAKSCEGRGTVFFFGNGMFNTKYEAQDSLDKLTEKMKFQMIPDQQKNIKFDFAYKTDESVLIQLFNVVNQKGIDEWENFWLWLSSLKKAPEWFQELMKSQAVEVLKNGMIGFDDLKNHFEKYSDYIREGYNVILVSHSQGNFYANQAMRNLSDYVDASLTGSLSEKRKENPFFPDFFEIFSNIQVATPVSFTVHASPWSTFQDDWIMDFVRKFSGALPANPLEVHVEIYPQPLMR